MPVTTIAGNEVAVDEEGVMSECDQWGEDIGGDLAGDIGIEMGERHW